MSTRDSVSTYTILMLTNCVVFFIWLIFLHGAIELGLAVVANGIAHVVSTLCSRICVDAESFHGCLGVGMALCTGIVAELALIVPEIRFQGQRHA